MSGKDVVGRDATGALPHLRHLMGQAPGFECLEEGVEFGDGGTDLLLVIKKATRFVVGDFVVVFAHISEDAEEALVFGGSGAAKGTVRNGVQQCDEEAAVLRDEALDQITLGEPDELGFEVWGHVPARERVTQCLHFVRRDRMQQASLHDGEGQAGMNSADRRKFERDR